jgi:hypothetical protein
VAIGSFLSCRQIVGIEDSPREDITSNACGLPFGTSACASCASTSCCRESNACSADSICRSYESCVGNCKSDVECRTKCFFDYPTGTAGDVTALSACLAKNCEAECGLTCGGFAGVPVETDAAAGCQSCLTSKGCAQERACATSADCDGYNRCAAANPGVAPQSFTCATAYGYTFDYGSNPPCDAGDAQTLPCPNVDRRAYTNVWTGACATACQAGNYWACVGSVTYSNPVASSTMLHFWLRDFFHQKDVSGANVSACNEGDAVCSPALQSQTTDATGEVSLPLALDRSGFVGSQYQGLRAFLKVTAPTYMPYYYDWGHPLAAPEAYFYGEVTGIADWQMNAANLHVTVDPNRGHLGVTVYDCFGVAAPGVHVDLGGAADSETHSFTLGALESNVTDTQGQLFFFNVIPGTVTVTTTPSAIAPRHSGVVTTLAYMGAITSLLAFPTP